MQKKNIFLSPEKPTNVTNKCQALFTQNGQLPTELVHTDDS